MLRVLFVDVRPSTVLRVEDHLRKLGRARVARGSSSQLDFNVDRMVFDADEDPELEAVKALRAHPVRYAAPAFALMTTLTTCLAVRLAKIGAVPMGECHGDRDASELARAIYAGAVVPMIAVPRSLAKIAVPDEETIARALEQNDGCVTRAAKAIGIPRPTLQYRMWKLGLRARARALAVSVPSAVQT